ncbi:hypothetical protein [Sphingomonas faeni]|uniref:hypothetical protein n=1 Tax=Sphingomonas faeni TaxID=185950 RepID=UPI0020C77179|nr:hypothetical protein [Sphingomonas faeni]MCP8891648.1 hypothetical protein [Sphingomonas faeni]
MKTGFEMAHTLNLYLRPLFRSLTSLNIRATIGGGVLSILIIGEAAFAYAAGLV